MFKQSVSLVEFSKLYNILYESNDLFSFNIFNYQNSKEFLKEIESNNDECINSTIIVDKKDHVLMSNNKININNILVMDTWPLKIEKLLDKINTQLIKQKYNFHNHVRIVLWLHGPYHHARNICVEILTRIPVSTTIYC